MYRRFACATWGGIPKRVVIVNTDFRSVFSFLSHPGSLLGCFSLFIFFMARILSQLPGPRTSNWTILFCFQALFFHYFPVADVLYTTLFQPLVVIVTTWTNTSPLYIVFSKKSCKTLKTHTNLYYHLLCVSTIIRCLLSTTVYYHPLSTIIYYVLSTIIYYLL